MKRPYTFIVTASHVRGRFMEWSFLVYNNNICLVTFSCHFGVIAKVFAPFGRQVDVIEIWRESWMQLRYTERKDLSQYGDFFPCLLCSILSGDRRIHHRRIHHRRTHHRRIHHLADPPHGGLTTRRIHHPADSPPGWFITWITHQLADSIRRQKPRVWLKWDTFGIGA